MYRIRGGYLIRQIVGEWVVVAIGGDATQPRAFMSLNDSGALLWQALKRGADERALADSLVDAYGIERARAEADAKAFVARLVEGGIAEAI